MNGDNRIVWKFLTSNIRLFLLWASLILPICLTGGDLRIEFVHTIAGKELKLDSLEYQNEHNETFSVTRMDWLASEFSLVGHTGKVTVKNSQETFIHREDGSWILRDIPNGSYKALEFFVGLNASTNHSDPSQYPAGHALNPIRNNLHWDWQGGYIFMAIEGLWKSRNTNQTQGYALHYATDRYFTKIHIPFFEFLDGDTTITISVSIDKILENLSFQKDGFRTHSRKNDPLAALLKKNLPGAFAIKSIRSERVENKVVPIQPIDFPDHFTPYSFQIPAYIPIPNLPSDNPLIVERVQLGKKLFEDTLLSLDQSISCASCHKKDEGFSDTRKVSLGVKGRAGNRQSMPLTNLAWKKTFFWDGRASTLREQVLMPIQDKNEMALELPQLIQRLKKAEEYSPYFNAAFRSGEITPLNISLALESFLITLVQFDSKFDSYIRGDEKLSTSELRGMQLFYSESNPRLNIRGADCFHCHGGPLFSDNQFHHTGLDINQDTGRQEITNNTLDAYKFATPSLRNTSLTGPYMHDGRFQTLEEVVEHYSKVPSPAPTLSPNIAKHSSSGLSLSDSEKSDLVNFLKTLSPSPSEDSKKLTFTKVP